MGGGIPCIEECFTASLVSIRCQEYTLPSLRWPKVSPNITRCPPRGRSPPVRSSGLTGGLLATQRISGSCCPIHQGGFTSLQIADLHAVARKLVSAHILKPHQSMEISLCMKDRLRAVWGTDTFFACWKDFSTGVPHPSHHLTLKMPRRVEQPVWTSTLA